MTSKTIYNTLSSKPHNTHYLTRYIKFIENRNIIRVLEYKENHHILPISICPEYAKVTWNKIFLTPREHLIAHYIFAKAIGGKHWFSVNMMLNCNNPYQYRKAFNKLNSRLFETLRIETSKSLVIMATNNRKNESQEITDSRITKWKESYGNDKEKLAKALIKGRETYNKNLASGKTKPRGQYERVTCVHCENPIAIPYLKRHTVCCLIYQEKKREKKKSNWRDTCLCRKTDRHICKIDKPVKVKIVKPKIVKPVKVKIVKPKIVKPVKPVKVKIVKPDKPVKPKIVKPKIVKPRINKHICRFCSESFWTKPLLHAHSYTHYATTFLDDWALAKREYGWFKQSIALKLRLSELTDEERKNRNFKTKQGNDAYYASDRYDRELKSKQVKDGLEKNRKH